MERAVGGGAELVVTGYALRWLPRGTELRNEVIQVHRPLVHFLYLAATRPLMTDGDREDRVDITKADRVPAFGQMLVVERPAHVHHEPSVFPEAIAAHIAIRLRAWLEVAANTAECMDRRDIEILVPARHVEWLGYPGQSDDERGDVYPVSRSYGRNARALYP